MGGRGEACDVGIKSVDIPHAIDSSLLFSFDPASLREAHASSWLQCLTFMPRAHMVEGTEHITHVSMGAIASGVHFVQEVEGDLTSWCSRWCIGLFRLRVVQILR